MSGGACQLGMSRGGGGVYGDVSVYMCACMHLCVCMRWGGGGKDMYVCKVRGRGGGYVCVYVREE